MQPDFHQLETDLLACLIRHDLVALAAMLTDEFVITTAGWIQDPVDRDTWLAEMAGSATLETATVHSVITRRYDGCVVVLALSSQAGVHQGQAFDMDFRYTDVWVRGEGDQWLLDVRHAGVVGRR